MDEEVIHFESTLIEQMCGEVSSLRLESDAQLQRLEAYFEWAQRKYPLIDNKENQSPEDQSHHRRFINTPPIRTRPAISNAIMSTHLPWKFEEMIVAKMQPGSSKKPNRSFVGTPSRANNSINNSMASNQGRSNAITMLNMFRDRCTTQRTRLDHSASVVKTAKKQRHFASPTPSTSSTTTSSTTTFYSGLGSSRVFTEKLFESTATHSPDTIILRQRCETNSVIHLQPQPGNKHKLDTLASRSDFLSTSPSGRFILPDTSNPGRTLSAIEDVTASSRSDNATICDTPLSASDLTVVEASTGGSSLDSSSSNAAVTARRIVFSPEATVRMNIDEAEEALFNVSDTVLQVLLDD